LGLSRFVIRTKADGTADTRRRIIDTARRTPSIVALAEVIGPWDFEFGVCLRPNEGVNEVIAKLSTAARGSLSTVSVACARQYIKIRNYPFDELPR
jgi:hypothetical protein